LPEAARGFPKPVYAMVVGRHAPAEKQMGHAGALIRQRPRRCRRKA